MLILRAFGLFVVTAIAEIVGCHLPYLWLKRNGSPWLRLADWFDGFEARPAMRATPLSGETHDQAP